MTNFKIGDRVRGTSRARPSEYAGKTGTVVACPVNRTFLAAESPGKWTFVQMDEQYKATSQPCHMEHWEIDLVAPTRQMLLPADGAERKALPIATGVMDYFPLALAYVARVSKAGNDQHNPGQELHWDKSKSKDHADCIARHLIDRGTLDPTDGLLHEGKLAWRALALLETALGNGTEP